MRNQVYVMGRFELAPDEAFVVDVSDGGAEYFTVPLSNVWGTTLDIVDRTGSFYWAFAVSGIISFMSAVSWGLIIPKIETIPWPDPQSTGRTAA